MKQKVLGMMSGALMCLSLVFSSCGNVDNPLEEIGNSNPVVAQLKDALADGAVITITFNLNGEQTITFKKGEDGYMFDGAEADNMRYHLEYDDENGLFIFSIRGVDEDFSIASQIILNPKDNSFYIINNYGSNTTSDGTFSVNGVEGTLTDVCPDKATINLLYVATAECRGARKAGTGSDPSFSVGGGISANKINSLIVRYKKGETWKNVIERYFANGFDFVFVTDGEPENLSIYVRQFISETEYWFELRYGNICKVKPDQKVGVKDDEVFGDAFGESLSSTFCYPATYVDEYAGE